MASDRSFKPGGVKTVPEDARTQRVGDQGDRQHAPEQSKTVLLKTLRPTQVTIGFAYVEVKAIITQRYKGTALQRFLRDHAIRVVRGPGGLYVVDHHHWAVAWSKIGIKEAPVNVLRDFSNLDAAGFWESMRANSWLHLYDANGRPCDVSALPSALDEMEDDPYHSLAALARRAGAYRKPDRPYMSFVWADYMREHVDRPSGGPGAFSLALLMAIKAARKKEAAGLPGYIGKR